MVARNTAPQGISSSSKPPARPLRVLGFTTMM